MHRCKWISDKKGGGMGEGGIGGRGIGGGGMGGGGNKISNRNQKIKQMQTLERIEKIEIIRMKKRN